MIDINICIDEDRGKFFIIFIYLYEISIINFFFVSVVCYLDYFEYFYCYFDLFGFFFNVSGNIIFILFMFLI